MKKVLRFLRWPFPRGWQVLKQEIGGIKCDVPGCGWEDDTAKVEEYKASGWKVENVDIDVLRAMLAKAQNTVQ